MQDGSEQCLDRDRGHAALGTPPLHPPALAGAAPSPGNAPHTYSLCGRDLTFKERTL